MCVLHDAAADASRRKHFRQGVSFRWPRPINRGHRLGGPRGSSATLALHWLKCTQVKIMRTGELAQIVRRDAGRTMGALVDL